MTVLPSGGSFGRFLGRVPYFCDLIEAEGLTIFGINIDSSGYRTIHVDGTLAQWEKFCAVALQAYKNRGYASEPGSRLHLGPPGDAWLFLFKETDR
jgi:hypothetical protein